MFWNPPISARSESSRITSVTRGSSKCPPTSGAVVNSTIASTTAWMISSVHAAS
jgi:hypothetical protein